MGGGAPKQENGDSDSDRDSNDSDSDSGSDTRGPEILRGEGNVDGERQHQDDMDWAEGRRQVGGPGNGGRGSVLPGSGGDDRHKASEELKIGHFAFFLAGSAPFLVGKVLELREHEGVQEIRVHWFTPFNRNLRNSSSIVPLAEYSRVTFGADYGPEEAPHGRSVKHATDVDWERSSRVVVSCTQLIAKGKKLPASVCCHY